MQISIKCKTRQLCVLLSEPLFALTSALPVCLVSHQRGVLSSQIGRVSELKRLLATDQPRPVMTVITSLGLLFTSLRRAAFSRPSQFAAMAPPPTRKLVCVKPDEVLADQICFNSIWPTI